MELAEDCQEQRDRAAGADFKVAPGNLAASRGCILVSGRDTWTRRPFIPQPMFNRRSPAGPPG